MHEKAGGESSQPGHTRQLPGICGNYFACWSNAVAKIAASALVSGAVAVPVRLALLGRSPIPVFAGKGIIFTGVYLATLGLIRVLTAEEIDLLRGDLDRVAARIVVLRVKPAPDD